MMKSSKSQPKFKIYATKRVIKRSKSENGGRQKSSIKFNSLMYLKPNSLPKGQLFWNVLSVSSN